MEKLTDFLFSATTILALVLAISMMGFWGYAMLQLAMKL